MDKPKYVDCHVPSTAKSLISTLFTEDEAILGVWSMKLHSANASPPLPKSPETPIFLVKQTHRKAFLHCRRYGNRYAFVFRGLLNTEIVFGADPWPVPTTWVQVWTWSIGTQALAKIRAGCDQNLWSAAWPSPLNHIPFMFWLCLLYICLGEWLVLEHKEKFRPWHVWRHMTRLHVQADHDCPCRARVYGSGKSCRFEDARLYSWGKSCVSFPFFFCTFCTYFGPLWHLFGTSFAPVLHLSNLEQ